MGEWGNAEAGLLLCPVCGAALEYGPSGAPGEPSRTAHCAAPHRFDVARQGYVNLLTGAASPGGDTKEMVAARTEFLAAGHYDRLSRAVAEAAAGTRPPPAGVVLDAGTGTGHYLARVLDALPQARGIGLDASKFAARRAARAHPRAFAAVWDVWRPLPVPTGSAALVLNVFAPRNGPEFHRVLAADGALLVVTPTTRHLRELRAQVPMLSVDAAKEERVHRTLDAYFTREHEEVLEYAGQLTLAEAAQLVAMGPSAHHVPDPAAALASVLRPPVDVTFAFRLAVYRPRQPAAQGASGPVR